jgi:hypothetical protein
MRVAVLFGLVVCAACSAESSAPAGNASATNGTIPPDETPSPNDPASGDDPKPPPSEDDVDPTLPPVTFHITFDYRFDTKGFFTSPDRRKALEGAARIWGRLVKSDFPTVPKGTPIKVRDPEHPAEPAQALDADDDIEDLVIFVGSSTFAGSVTASSQATAGLAAIEDEALRTALDQRFHGTPFQPWTGWISFDESEPWYFDPNPDVAKTIPAGKLDFVSVALHEMGHVLGFGTADAFKALASNGSFGGTKAKAAAGGTAPALSGDGSHFASTVLVSGKRPLMDVSDAAATRYLPTSIDLAVLEDLGFQF